MVRHSRQDALTDDEFEHLLEVAGELEDPYDAQVTFVLVAGGRLGMRGGEICHLHESWINWKRSMIEIPSFEPCSCGYCRKRAKSAAEHNDGLTFEEAMDRRWNPKTRNSARAIPFDFSDRVEAVVTAFFDRYDAYPHSRVSVNRRVDRVALRADLDPSRVYPHALRATAATHHAYRGVPTTALQNLMGWEQLTTAQKYIRLSGEPTANALREAHAD
jgi:integrase